MKIRIFSNLSIFVKLVVISIVVAAGMGINLYVAWKSLSGLSATVRDQADTSALLLANTDFEERAYSAWLALYRVRVDMLQHSSDLVGADSTFNDALKASKVSLDNLVSIKASSGVISMFGDIKRAYDDFTSAASASSSAFQSVGVNTGDLFQVAALKFDALSAELVS